MMEADSTTYDNNTKSSVSGSCLPFNTCPGNFKLYKELMNNSVEKSFEMQIVERLHIYGLLPSEIKCLSNTPECRVICRPARVVDRLQWMCEGCGKRQPIRDGSFFYRLQCSIPQALQIMLAWCEDADCNVAADHFGVKTKVAGQIFDKLDELAIKEYSKTKLGGANSVVLLEMYPDCMNRLSPDTTDHPHAHRILMLADTNHIPTYYRLQVLKEDLRKNAEQNSQHLQTQIQSVVAKAVTPDSTLVTGTTIPLVDGAVPIQQLTQQCDVDMQQFLSTRIWRQAITLCASSRDLCAGAMPPSLCASAVQRYLDASLYRLRYGDGLYQHMLNVVAEEYTSKSL